MAPTLVLLHALGASGGAWDQVRARLGVGYACVAPDLPGFGAEPALPGGVAATLGWLAAEIARLPSAAYLLVGHSMGGKFATLLAARAEAGDAGLSGLAGVVLLAGSPPSPEPMDEGRRAEMVGWFADGPPGDADARRFVAANVAHPPSTKLKSRAIADVRRSSPAAWIDWLERGSREDWSDRVGRLSTPALIVAGGEDGDLGEVNQRRLNVPHFASARVVVLPRAAHLLPYEQPAAVAGLIDAAARSWLPEPLPAPARLGRATSRSMGMSIEGKAKEAAGFVKEELNEHGDTPEAKQKAQEGRDLRNEGRVEDGKAPKTTEPGTGHKED